MTDTLPFYLSQWVNDLLKQNWLSWMKSNLPQCPKPSCINNMGVDFNNVWAFVSDSASYMKKAFTSILKGLFPNSGHVTCFSHLLSLVLEVFPEVFQDVNRLCALVEKVLGTPASSGAEIIHAGKWPFSCEYMDVLTDFTTALSKTVKYVQN
jgi:hypothetical protein